MLFIDPLEKIDQCVKEDRHNAEDHNSHDHGGKLENLAGIDDQISQAGPGGEKLADDDAHQAEADIDFHRIQKDRHRTGQDDFGEHIPFPAAQGINEFGFLRVHFQKAGVSHTI